MHAHGGLGHDLPACLGRRVHGRTGRAELIIEVESTTGGSAHGSRGTGRHGPTGHHPYLHILMPLRKVGEVAAGGAGGGGAGLGLDEGGGGGGDIARM